MSGRVLRIAGWSTGALLLLAPLVAMRFTDAVDWGLEDFLSAGALVLAVGGGLELAVRRTRHRAMRAGAALALATAFVLVGANAAVGVIGSEDNPVNRLYAGVVAVGAMGTLLARFRPRGMALAMVATAIAQVAVAVVAVLAGQGFAGPATLVFTALWLAAAALFRTAAIGQRPG